MERPCWMQGGARRTELHDALDRVLDAEDSNDGALLSGALVALDAVRRVLDGAEVGLLSHFESSMAWATGGYRCPTSWVVANTGAPRRAAGSVRRVCLAAARMPHVSVAAGAGALTHAHVRLLVDAREAPVEALFDRDEEALVAEACVRTADSLRLHLDRWRIGALGEAGCNEPDPPEPRSGGNRLRIHPGFAGSALFDGELTPEGWATVEAAIDAEIDRLRSEGSLEKDRRSYEQLRGDVLVELIARGAARPDAVPGRPLIIAVVDLDTLLRRAGCPDPAARTARRAEILGHGPVDDATVAELLTRANVSLLLADRGVPLWFGRSRRLATPAQRSAALAASHGHCYWPGCTAPAHRCDTDHLTGWEDGGCTDIDNLAPICRFHNRLKHRERYRAERRPDGTVVVTDRFGVELATRYQHDP